MAQTHEVFNQFGELADYDLLATDPALREALARADAGWAAPMLSVRGSNRTVNWQSRYWDSAARC